MDGDGGASLRKRLCNGGSQTCGGACHEGDFLVETEEIEDVLHTSSLYRRLLRRAN